MEFKKLLRQRVLSSNTAWAWASRLKTTMLIMGYFEHANGWKTAKEKGSNKLTPLSMPTTPMGLLNSAFGAFKTCLVPTSYMQTDAGQRQLLPTCGLMPCAWQMTPLMLHLESKTHASNCLCSSVLVAMSKQTPNIGNRLGAQCTSYTPILPLELSSINGGNNRVLGSTWDRVLCTHAMLLLS